MRTAVADLLPEHVAGDVAPVPDLLVALGMPGKVAGFLRTGERDDAERAARLSLIGVLHVSEAEHSRRNRIKRC
ncbi:hypothetical protein ABZT02_34835 [Streptomyces sp. NPDC005402]|uniref:hypothetical protein n=1 Tax=Streptomyces sp. NPDC005402 TaxID=3155338 RepID=UPI0033AF9811